MPPDHIVLFTDAVDSAQLTEQLGDAAASMFWAAHDRVLRSLIRIWHGREIDKSDGFLILFHAVENAIGFGNALHAACATLEPPLACRVGIHRGPLVMRSNPPDEQALGAKPVEIDGMAKAVAARIMGLARGGQTLLSAAAYGALSEGTAGASVRVDSHGFWRAKGVAEPFEVFECGTEGAVFIPPPESNKTYRVVRVDGDWVPLAHLQHHLPAERDAFVGREDSLAVLHAYFESGVRLISMLGMGGIGKTRLALRYSRRFLGDYPGGAWFCDISAARDLDGVAHAVAQGLTVPLNKADPVQQLGAALLGRGPCLVILDNFEQVARLAEVTIRRWLDLAPETRFLVTSREVLGIAGEQTLVLAPLGREEAEQLFNSRACAADDRYKPSVEDQKIMPLLMDLLDRLPLAIELAAARVRVMSPYMMLDRMSERFKLLAGRGGRRDRQSTLREALDWSWDLLSAPEQTALAQLSVFEGGFALDAAEAVIQLGDDPEVPTALDLVQGLVEKSLLRHLRADRFEMLRSVQDYASERLVSIGAELPLRAEAASAQRRHWVHFASLDEAAATREHCVDLDNLLIACRRAAGRDAEAAVRALEGAWAALRLTGPFRAGIELAGMVGAPDNLSASQRAAVDSVMGAALTLTGDVAAAAQRYESALRHAKAAADKRTLTRVHRLFADLEIGRSRFATALEHLTAAMALARETGERRAQFLVLSGFGALAMKHSRLAEARQHYEAALQLAVGEQDQRWLGGLHGNLGGIALLEGRLLDAQMHYQQALGAMKEVGDRQWEGNTRCNLGLLLHQLGDDGSAWAELEVALKLARSIGHRRLEALTLCNRGIVAGALRDQLAALSAFAEAVQVAAALTDSRMEAEFRGYMGLALARLGRIAEQEACFGRAFALSPDDDPGARGLLCCQRAIAAALVGNEAERGEWCNRAANLLEPLNLPAGSHQLVALDAAKVASTQG